MNDDARLEQMLRAALPPMEPAAPSRDVWQSIVARGGSRRPGWIDVAIGAMTILALLRFPGWLWLLAYHL
ncbi:MAG: hypothetical protein A3H96_00955 [Acidobacteria bacterium RIFCSPLOWO2_02_FULL_67_36]|nr:MAG: hypothetical protein A3H96_00955 [Acidobacteria bacterium RIFCSPLOWO2_02_FULL_67_36]OFW23020.1 MAG: hypothetical protein A3G21_00395 [Acidobacteria bacterium RIFCSPLOWO2_12_FULL_66_21]